MQVVGNPSFSGSTGGLDDDEMGRGPGKAKSGLVLAAERVDRRTAMLTGDLKKKNSAEKWQRRYFEILDHYWVYYKSRGSGEMLCAMDLWKAGRPDLAPLAPGDSEQCVFSITWDRYRLFRAASQAEAARWVNAIVQVQAMRPPEPALAGGGSLLAAGPPTPSLAGYAKTGAPGAGAVEEWRGGAAPAAGADLKGAAKRKTGASALAVHSTAAGEPEGGICGSCSVS